jgi:hypothetical protein
MNLGVTVSQMRSSNHFVDGNSERRQWLDDESSVWKLMPGNTERTREAAVHYGRGRDGAGDATAGSTSTE